MLSKCAFLESTGALKKSAAAYVESVFSGAGKFTAEAKSAGLKLLERMVKLHNWKYLYSCGQPRSRLWSAIRSRIREEGPWRNHRARRARRARCDRRDRLASGTARPYSADSPRPLRADQNACEKTSG